MNVESIYVLDLSENSFRLEENLSYADLIIQEFQRYVKESKGKFVAVIYYEDKFNVIQNFDVEKDHPDFLRALSKDSTSKKLSLNDLFFHFIKVGVFALNFYSTAKNLILITQGLYADSNTLVEKQLEILKLGQSIYRMNANFRLQLVGKKSDDDFGFICDLQLEAYIKQILTNPNSNLLQAFYGDELISVHFRDYYLKASVEKIIEKRKAEGFKLKQNTPTKLHFELSFLPYVNIEYKVRVQELRVDVHVVTLKEFAKYFVHFVKYGGNSFNNVQDPVLRVNIKLLEFLRFLSEADENCDLMGHLGQPEQFARLYKLTHSNSLIASWYSNIIFFSKQYPDMSSLEKISVADNSFIYLLRFNGHFNLISCSEYGLGFKIECTYSLTENPLDAFGDLKNQLIPFYLIHDIEGQYFLKKLTQKFDSLDNSLLKSLLCEARKDFLEIRSESIYFDIGNKIYYSFRESPSEKVIVDLYFPSEAYNIAYDILKNDSEKSLLLNILLNLREGSLSSCLLTSSNVKKLLSVCNPVYQEAINIPLFDHNDLEFMFFSKKTLLKNLEAASHNLKFFLLVTEFMTKDFENNGWKILFESDQESAKEIAFVSCGNQQDILLLNLKLPESESMISLEGYVINYHSLQERDNQTIYYDVSVFERRLKLFSCYWVKAYYCMLIYSYSVHGKLLPFKFDTFHCSNEKPLLEFEEKFYDDNLITSLKELILTIFIEFEPNTFAFLGKLQNFSWEQLIIDAENPIFLRLTSNSVVLGLLSASDTVMSSNFDEVEISDSYMRLSSLVSAEKMTLIVDLQKKLAYVVDKHKALDSVKKEPISVQTVRQIEDIFERHSTSIAEKDLPYSSYLPFLRKSAALRFIDELKANDLVTCLNNEYFMVNIDNFEKLNFLLSSYSSLTFNRTTDRGLGIILENQIEENQYDTFDSHCLYIKISNNFAKIQLLAPYNMKKETCDDLKKAAEVLVHDTVFLANQKSLLKELNETRHCSPYLISPTDEEEGNETEDEEDSFIHELQKYSQASFKFSFGMFECPIRHRFDFPLYWRFKQNQALSFLSANVLHPFSVSNRKGVFVYAEEENIFYFNLWERHSSSGKQLTEISGAPDAKISPSFNGKSNLFALNLEIRGIAELSDKFQEFIRMIETKLHGLTLSHISTLLSRNASLRLSGQDIQFIMDTSNDQTSKKLAHHCIIPSALFFSYAAIALSILKKHLSGFITPFSSFEIISAIKSYFENFPVENFEDSTNYVDFDIGDHIFIYNNTQLRVSSPGDNNYFGQGIGVISISVQKTNSIISKAPIVQTELIEDGSKFLEFFEARNLENEPYCFRFDLWLQGPVNHVALMEHISNLVNLSLKESMIELCIGKLTDISLKSSNDILIPKELSLKDRPRDLDLLFSFLKLQLSPLSQESIISERFNIRSYLPELSALRKILCKSFHGLNLVQFSGFNGDLPLNNNDLVFRFNDQKQSCIMIGGINLNGLAKLWEPNQNLDSSVTSKESLDAFSLSQTLIIQHCGLKQELIRSNMIFIVCEPEKTDPFIEVYLYNINYQYRFKLLDQIKDFANKENDVLLCLNELLIKRLNIVNEGSHTLEGSTKYEQMKSIFNLNISLDLSKLSYEEQSKNYLEDNIQLASRNGFQDSEGDSWIQFFGTSRILHWCRAPIIFSPLRDTLFKLSGNSYICSIPNIAEITQQKSTERSRASSSISTALNAFPEDSLVMSWFSDMINNFTFDYVSYLKSLGMKVLFSSLPTVASEYSAIPSSLKPFNSKFTITKDLIVNSPFVFLEKCFPGGSLLIDISFNSMFISVNVYTSNSLLGEFSGDYQSGRTAVDDLVPNWSHSDNINRTLFKAFTEEASKFKNIIHLNSFVYDFHLRYIRTSLLQGNCNWLDWESSIRAFLTYNKKPANFSRNMILMRIFKIEKSMTRDEMFKYIGRHPDHFSVNLFYFDGKIKGAIKQLESSSDEVSHLLIIFASNAKSTPEEYSPWILEFCVLRVYLKEIYPFLYGPGTDSKGLSFLNRFSSAGLSDSEQSEKDILNSCEKFVIQLVENVFAYYARDSLWRRLVNSLQNAASGNAGDFTLADFLVLSTRYHTRPVVNLEPSIEKFLQNEYLHWNEMIEYLMKIFSQSREFIEKRMQSLTYGQIVRHLIILNPQSSDLLIHLAVDHNNNCLVLESVSREWREITMQEKLNAKKKLQKVTKSEDDASVTQSRSKLGSTSVIDSERQESIELGFVSEIVQCVCYFLLRKSISLANQIP